MKLLFRFLSISAVIVGVVLVGQVPVSAKTTYQYSYRPSSNNVVVPYFTKTAKVVKGGAIWNVKHTKKIGNLKNEPYSRWWVEKVYTKKRNGKVISYYYQAVKPRSRGKNKALIWSGYLNKAISKAPSQFKTDSEYDKYIQTADSQRLTRALLKLFPNTQVSLKLSQMADDGATYAPSKLPGFKDIINIGIPGFTPESTKIPAIAPADYLWDTKGEPVTKRVKEFDKQLSLAGYPMSVREKMTEGRIGIIIIDETTSTKDPTTKPGLPSHEGDGMMMVYKIVYGIPTK